jgi:hypothetical protein
MPYNFSISKKGNFSAEITCSDTISPEATWMNDPLQYSMVLDDDMLTISHAFEDYSGSYNPSDFGIFYAPSFTALFD